MAWVAFDRAIWAVEKLGLDGPVDRWRAARAEIHAEVCRERFDRERNTFVQSYGTRELDASLLKIPLVGFLPATDPRVAGTVEAVRRELSLGDGLIRRYSTGSRGAVDGIDEDEGAFLACSFWLVDNLTLVGRLEEARATFTRACSRSTTTWDCSQRNTTSAHSASRATSRRPSRTSPSSTAPRCSRGRAPRDGPSLAGGRPAPPAPAISSSSLSKHAPRARPCRRGRAGRPDSQRARLA